MDAAENAWEAYSDDRFRDDGAVHDGFMAGRASRDAEVAELRVLLAKSMRTERHDEIVAELREQVAEARAFLPPEGGWQVFGTNAGNGLPVRFSDELDDGGLPKWERVDADAIKWITTGYEDQLEAAQATIEKVISAVNGPHPANSGLDSFTLAYISAALPAPASTAAEQKESTD